MTEDDFVLAWKQYKDNTKESDVDTGNSELKTKCILWTARLDIGGYGVVTFMDRHMKASRFVWSISNKVSPNELQCRHKCRNKSCVNIDHLELGTQRQNSLDALERDKTLPQGEQHYNVKISDEVAKKILESKSSGLTQQERANEFGVSLHFVSDIDRGKTRKYLLSEKDKKEIESSKVTTVTQDQFDKIKKYQSQGLGIELCAELMKLKVSTIRGIFARDVLKYTKSSKYAGLKWYEVVLSQKEISKHIEHIKSRCVIDEKEKSLVFNWQTNKWIC
jgi:hypothetical protein